MLARESQAHSAAAGHEADVSLVQGSGRDALAASDALRSAGFLVAAIRRRRCRPARRGCA